MKFIPLINSENQIPLDSLKSEYKQAKQIERIYLGSTNLFSRKMFTVKYIPYSEIYRVFRRVECVNLKMCCSSGELQLENIVICDKKNELLQIDLSRKEASEAVIEEIKKHNPDVKIGVKK